jgi:hypothetical protein
VSFLYLLSDAVCISRDGDRSPRKRKCGGAGNRCFEKSSTVYHLRHDLTTFLRIVSLVDRKSSISESTQSTERQSLRVAPQRVCGATRVIPFYKHCASPVCDYGQVHIDRSSSAASYKPRFSARSAAVNPSLFPIAGSAPQAISRLTHSTAFTSSSGSHIRGVF